MYHRLTDPPTHNIWRSGFEDFVVGSCSAYARTHARTHTDTDTDSIYTYYMHTTYVL